MYNSNTLCPICHAKIRTSFPEQVVSYYMSKAFGFVENSKSVNNVEVDIYIADYGIAIEYDGFYWHTDKYQKDFDKNFFLKDKIFIRVREEGLEPITDYNCYNVFTDRSFLSLDKVIDCIFNYLHSLSIDFIKPGINTLRDKEKILSHLRSRSNRLGRGYYKNIKALKIVSKLVFNKELVGVRFELNGELVDFDTQSLQINCINLDLTNVKTELMFNYNGVLMTEYEHENDTQIYNGSGHRTALNIIKMSKYNLVR